MEHFEAADGVRKAIPHISCLRSQKTANKEFSHTIPLLKNASQNALWQACFVTLCAKIPRNLLTSSSMFAR